MHPTVKPVALVADAIRDCSKRNGIILDPFAGSGTAVIAAEKTGRRAAVIDIDPYYVDTIIRRWQDLTGQTAVHAAEQMTFADRERAIATS
jgi:DNA modification methylase